MWSVFVVVIALSTGQVLYHEHSSDSLPTRKDCEDIIKDRGIELAKILIDNGIRDFKMDLSCEQLGTDL